MNEATHLNCIPQLDVGRATGKTKWVVFDALQAGDVVSFASLCALKMLQVAEHHLAFDYRTGRCQHIAALGLIVWFLMVPPLVNAPWKVDTQAPLRRWRTVSIFQAKSECDKTLSSIHNTYNSTATARIGAIEKGTRAFALQMVFSQCVAGNDPDLQPTGDDAVGWGRRP
jgi:hypothetical protein